MVKKNVSSAVVILFIFVTLFLSPGPLSANFNKGYPDDKDQIEVKPAGLAKGKQTIKVKVKGQATPNPMTVWTQGDYDIWQATRNEGDRVETGTQFSGTSALPKSQKVRDKINTANYIPASLADAMDNKFKKSFVKEVEIEKIEYMNAPSYSVSAGAKPQFEKGKLTVVIETETGYPNIATEKEPYGTRQDGDPKYQAKYNTPLKIDYVGYVNETKEIRVREDMQLQVNDVKSLVAEIRTKQYDQDEFGGWTNVSKRADQIEWSSNKSGVVSVEEKTGKITAHKIGEAIITAKWKNGPYYIYESATITVGEKPEKPDIKIPDAACSQAPAAEMVKEKMNPNPSAVIKADKRGSEQFDVLQGIPTSESLYGNVFSLNYLFKDKFVQMKGTCTYTVVVEKTYNKTWTKEDRVSDGKGGYTTISTPMSRDVTVPYTYTVKRDFDYWKIDTLLVYEITGAILKNYALPEIELYPADYRSPIYAAATNGTFYAADKPPVLTAPSQPVPGGTSEPATPVDDLSSIAEDAVREVQVQNDYLKFNGTVVMDNPKVEKIGPRPGQIPDPTVIGKDVLYSPDNEISNSLANKKNTASTGKITYELMSNNINDGNSEEEFDIPGINTVTVHTPVVDYAVLPDTNRPFDQRMNPDMSRVVLVLDRPFTINMTEKGQHLNIPGYGNRDYKKYTLKKRVMFPFDTYSSDKSKFYPKNTWVEIPVGQDSMSFKMPTWVDEGNYHITTEAWAVNSQGRAGCQQNFNGDLNNYCATEGFDVGVVGRLFGFRVWDIGDFRFENVFRTAKGSSNHTSAAYYSGGRDENGEPTTMYGKNSWLLPIRSGSHPTEKATVARNGYSFLFDFTTIGNVWDKGEGIRIDPTFYYVSKKGGTPIPVDLYYDSTGGTNKMIKVGSATDVKTFSRTYQLNDKFRNLNATEIEDAAKYEYNQIFSAAQRSALPWSKFWQQYTTRKTTIGAGYEIEVLPYQSRTIVGPKSIPSGVDSTEALRSVQHWYGEYNLPIAPYIVPKGTDVVALSKRYGNKLDGSEKEFLKKGYIVVNFGIYTLKNNNQNNRVLGYKAPLADMWAIEGQVASSNDYLGNSFSHRPGDIMFFESDYSVRNDYQGQGK
jgi:hypothetical protein